MADYYSYDPQTREFLGTIKAEPSPLGGDHLLVPAFATGVAPPEVGINQAAVFGDGSWMIVADHRGEKWFKGETSVTIVSLGDPSPLYSREPAVSAETVRAAFRASLQWLEDCACAAVISPGNRRLLQVKAARASAKPSERRDSEDVAVIDELSAITVRYQTIELHFAAQDAALDNTQDADLPLFRPRPFAA